MTQTSSREIISTRQRRLAELASEAPGRVLTTLAHQIDLMWLEEAYRRTRKDGAAGVDGVTAQEYEAALTANLTDLLDRFKSGRYRAPPVRRVHILKEGTNETRPIGIPTLEDGGQGAAAGGPDGAGAGVRAGLSGLFVWLSPRTHAHQALDALWQGLMAQRGGWVIDLDIQAGCLIGDVRISGNRG